MHRACSLRDICCKSPPHPWRSPGACTYTHACANVHTPYTVHWRGVPDAARLLAANGSRAGAAAKEASVSSGVQSQEAPLKSKQSTRAPAWTASGGRGPRLGPASPQRAGLEAVSGDVPARVRQAAAKKEGGGRGTRTGRARAARGEAVGSAGLTAVTRKQHLA